MDFNSLKLFNHLRGSSRKQFAVIGLGRFGKAVCQTLYKLGYDVLGTDINEKRVADALNQRIASSAIELDSTDPVALKQAGIFEFDTVIIAIGNYIQESIVTTLNVKEAGVECVVAKASTEIHGKLLKKVGADLVVFPEFDAGKELAHSLTKPAILERFELDPEHSIVEVIVPQEFNGKTLQELEFRRRYGLSVLAIGNGEKFIVNPTPDQRLYQGSAMVVIGSNKSIEKLPI
ncbi:MAG: TrkA family potassium uptake protein [Gloeocapsa sp. DLM2.Bin57]|nr:MAG: TrkA family potassium uptake protein [Gloeocapsa sp. DLM2.Bin57]